MKKIFQHKKLPVIMFLIGAMGGFLYWKYIGCLSGTCPIRSIWYWSTLWGAALGFLIGDLVYDLVVKRKKKEVKDEREISKHN